MLSHRTPICAALRQSGLTYWSFRINHERELADTAWAAVGYVDPRRIRCVFTVRILAAAGLRKVLALAPHENCWRLRRFSAQRKHAMAALLIRGTGGNAEGLSRWRAALTILRQMPTLGARRGAKETPGGGPRRVRCSISVAERSAP
jgi:hypothetical protein